MVVVILNNGKLTKVVRSVMRKLLASMLLAKKSNRFRCL